MAKQCYCLAIALAFLPLLAAGLQSWTPPAREDWSQQAIYQIITDRFARADGSNKRCTNFRRYCGGTFKGIEQHLDYIKGMGFTSIWMSPISEQTKGLTWDYTDGYHGFWPKNIYNINEHFGGKEQLRAMLDAVHKAGMLAMLDIVPNHMGYPDGDDYSQLVPFNESRYYHDCEGCGMFCSIASDSDDNREHCRLDGLPDLAHEKAEVSDKLVEWLQWLQEEYDFDAFRVDAAVHMSKTFNKALNKASKVFTIGEYYKTKPYDQVAAWIGDRLNSSALDSSLGIPMMFAMREVFVWKSAGMHLLRDVREHWRSNFRNKMPYIGMYLESHDEERFVCARHDLPLYQNALAFLFFTEGIPIVLYGAEQGLPGTRDPMWHSGYHTNSELYIFIKILNWYRTMSSLWIHESEDVYADDSYYVFARGEYVVALSSRGEGAARESLALKGLPARFIGDTLTNVLDPRDTLFVNDSSGALLVTAQNGMPQIFKRGAVKPLEEFGSYKHKMWPETINLILVITMSIVSVLLFLTCALVLRVCSACGHDSEGGHGMPRWLVRRRKRLDKGARKGSDGKAHRSHKGDMEAPHRDSSALLRGYAPSGSDSSSTLSDQEKGDFMEMWLSSAPTPAGRPAAEAAPADGRRLMALPSRRQLMATATGDAAPASAAAAAAEAGTGEDGTGSPRSDFSSGDSGNNSGKQSPITTVSDTSISYEDVLAPGDQQALLGAAQGKPCSAAAAADSKAPAALKRQVLGADVHEVHQLTPDTILHVAMEYTIPHLGYDDQFVYGGLGKVVDVFLRCWQGPLALCCPLYRGAYAHDRARHPMFSDKPIATFTVSVAYKLHQVDIYKLQAGNVTYFMLQADVFRWRERSSIYTFADESEMLTWLSVFSQAVSVVIRQYNVHQVQYHDYHGALSLMYLPPEEPVKVLYVAHNAHYNGAFPIPGRARSLHVYSMFDLNPGLCHEATEHKTAFDILHSVVHYMRKYQQGCGVVGVSPRYAEEILAKQSVFWELDSSQLKGITNALIQSPNNLAAQGLPFEEVLELKLQAKLQLQRRVGLHEGEQYQLLVFMGRMTHQKGGDILAEAAERFLAQHPLAQLICIGLIGDNWGATAQDKLEQLPPRFPGRVWCPRNQYAGSDIRDLLWQGADWALCPSRFEPCGLVDIEFGWNGALIIGHNTGGLGKMPGIYFTAESSRVAHVAAKLEDAVGRALAVGKAEKEQMIKDALVRRFPTDRMMSDYRLVWSTVSYAVDEEGQALRQEKSRRLQQFYNDKWKAANKQDGHNALDMGGAQGSGRGCGGSCLGSPVQRLRASDVSNFLLLILQSATLLPSLLLGGFAMWTETYITTISECRQGMDHALGMRVGMLSGLPLRAVMTFGTGTILAPLWTALAFRMRPASYIRLVAGLLFLQLLLASASLLDTRIIDVGLVLCAACSLSGNPLFALGNMGKELTTEVAEVGLSLMSITEFVRGLFLMTGALVTALSLSKTPFIAVASSGMVLSALMLAWFTWRPALSSEYRHMKLRAKGTFKMLRGVSSFYLTIAICALDMFAFSLVGFLCLLQWQLHFFVELYAVLFAVSSVAVVLLVGWLTTRWTQLHIHKWLLAVASLPGYSVALALVLWLCPDKKLMLALAAVVQLVLGERSHVVGLLGFQTLPSREAVAVWQLLVVGCSCVMSLLVTLAGTQMGLMVVVPTPQGILMVLGGVEAVRLLLCGVLMKRHGKEDLTAL